MKTPEEVAREINEVIQDWNPGRGASEADLAAISAVITRDRHAIEKEGP